MGVNIKKIGLLFLLIVVPFLVTGCSSNGSAEDVAVAMVKRLSNDNYKNIESIFYTEKGSYFDENVFQEVIKEKNLNISGNKKIEIKEVGGEITNSEGNTTVEVKIGIDNNKVFTINTIEVDDKWYVYDPDFFVGDIKIVVPVGSQVSVSGKKLTKDYLKSENIDVDISYYVKLEDIKMDVYTLKNVMNGKYNVTIKSKEFNDIKDIVYSNSSHDDSDNYIYDYDYEYDDNYNSKSIYTYIFSPTPTGEDVKDFVKDYLNSIYSNAVSTHSYDGVAKYFNVDEAQEDYQDLIDSVGDSSKSYYLTDFSIKDLKYSRIKYYNDDNIVADFSYELNYVSNYSTSKYNKTKSMNTILVLSKNDKDQYVITNGYRLFAK